MKKTLILVRHATAEDQTLLTKDFDRKLNSKGLAEAAVMGEWMREMDIKPDIFVTSPASRAYETAVITAGKLGVDVGSLVSNADIYDGGPEAYLAAVNTVPETYSKLALFGHNPDITYFAEYISGASIGSMKKGSVAIIEFENFKWEEISAKTGNLALYKTPKQVRDVD
ncbi:histidine phosphatase family protein [Dyadobacter chenwenxiniae]|uniref:Histidine phosphatase family protein n=1 Tax=Dyadobacter chenwenxiniae TaxID=2906456 RepID=A0A9X1THL7_9BACT|nr:histidine phosphatase family protein [Dyadobacter chenwenxiniae]MCF0050046.1 histidine phosphatase family protein [Dyadobacter chenwenxiniae]MCF0064915.1 histidine phosphatase family protein [Dyadobacter chenwenxiniae]UON83037.1 histidine phosphatase family protein [Dyadobacter chenwenxiniae]